MFILSQDCFNNVSLILDILKTPSLNHTYKKAIRLSVNEKGQKYLYCKQCGSQLKLKSYIHKKKRIVEGEELYLEIAQYYCDNKDCTCKEQGVPHYHLIEPNILLPGNNYVALVATATIRLLTKASVKSMVDLIKSKGVIVNEPLEVYLQRIFGDVNYFKKYCDYLKKPYIG